MKPIFTFPPPRLPQAIFPLKDPKNLSELPGPPHHGPCDLIVLPCSTAGTITTFVREKLVHHRLPYPKPGMALGDISVVPFVGGENIAQFVAFAASVHVHSSTIAAINRIGRRLGRETAERSAVRKVSAPLLGTGAGHLDSETVVQALADGFKREADKDAQLTLYVFDPAVFERVSVRQSQANESLLRAVEIDRVQRAATRVFLSYCHTSPDHEEWVKALGIFLRENGIDARLDAWHLRPGMDIPQFMTNELALADRVLLVSDERFAEKADGRVGGVGWETMIIQGDMAKLPPESTKYLIVVRSQDIDSGLPKYLKTKYVIHWPHAVSHEQNRNLLLKELYNIQSIPRLGSPPLFV